MMHTRDMKLKGHSKVIIRTADTYVLVLAICTFAKLQSHTKEFWVDLMQAKIESSIPSTESSMILENQKLWHYLLLAVA